MITWSGFDCHSQHAIEEFQTYNFLGERTGQTSHTYVFVPRQVCVFRTFYELTIVVCLLIDNGGNYIKLIGCEELPETN